VAKTLMSARSLALGGASICLQGWGSGASLNPATAVRGSYDASVSYARHTLDLWSGMIFLSAEITPSLTAGIFLSSFNYGNFDVSQTNIGLTGETFDAGEYIFSGFVAYKLTNTVDLGVSVKYLWGNIWDETAAGIAVDLGAIWNTGWENVNVGIAARNLGKQINSYGSEADPLPTEILIGGSRRIRHLPLTIHSVIIAAQSGEEDWTVDELPGSPAAVSSHILPHRYLTETPRSTVFVKL